MYEEHRSCKMASCDTKYLNLSPDLLKSKTNAKLLVLCGHTGELSPKYHEEKKVHGLLLTVQ